jgi:hypothetical protein
MAALSIGSPEPNEKSLLLLGLIAREFARRTHSLGKLAERVRFERGVRSRSRSCPIFAATSASPRPLAGCSRQMAGLAPSRGDSVAIL